MAVANDTTMLAGNSADGFNQQASAATSISSTGITVGASATGLVSDIVWQNGASTDITARTMTWNAGSMTEQPTVLQSNGVTRQRASIFVLPSPASGANTLAASWTGASDCYMSAASFTGTDTSTVVKVADNATQTGLPSTSITVTSATGDATYATFVVNGATPTVNFTKVWAEAPLSPGGGGSYTLGGTSNAHTFTGAGGSSSALVGVHILAAAGGAPTPMRTLMGVGLGVRLLAASRLVQPGTRREFMKRTLACFLPYK
jgi:hypothetical protein